VTSKIHSRSFFHCYFLAWFLFTVVGPAHLETICSQKGIGQQEAMFYRLV